MKKGLNGSITVEVSYLMPVVLLVIFVSINISFFFHDRAVINGAIVEVTDVAAIKMRERKKITKDEIERFLYERVSDKCIIMKISNADITLSEDIVRIELKVIGKGMSASLQKEAGISRPEKIIRNTKKVKNIGD